MNYLASLEKSIIEVFRRGIGNGYTEEEIAEMLESIDFYALAQCIAHDFETIYEYTIFGKLPLDMCYCGNEVFSRASFLYEEAGDCMTSAVCCSRSLEMWILDDASIAITALHHTDVGNGTFVANYRTYKGDDWIECDMCIDLEEFAEGLRQKCRPYYAHDIPTYEL